MQKTMTFADSPGIFVTFLSTGPQLKEVVFLQAEQTVSINIDHLKYVRQRLPVAEQGTELQIFLHLMISTYPSIQLLWWQQS